GGLLIAPRARVALELALERELGGHAGGGGGDDELEGLGLAREDLALHGIDGGGDPRPLRREHEDVVDGRRAVGGVAGARGVETRHDPERAAERDGGLLLLALRLELAAAVVAHARRLLREVGAVALVVRTLPRAGEVGDEPRRRRHAVALRD